MSFRVAAWLLAGVLGAAPCAAQEITYRVSFPQPEHRWMQVEATFPGGRPPLELRMSRSSAGRYALHEFAKNVYDVRAFDARGRELELVQPDPYGWTLPAFEGDVRVSYRIFGDRIDGTYLAIDTTHAHMNMPASFMWARGLSDRPVRITFEPPQRSWKAATQLFATDSPFTFTAPNLQYFLDSPTELGPIWEHRFTVPQPDGSGSASFRIALHHDGAEEAARRYAAGVEKIAREAAAIFGEFPHFEPGWYTFLGDYQAHASGDGMEHRNSTALTGRGNLADPRRLIGALDTVAHEFFHAWNAERIRPASLEPFDFEGVKANMSGELWLAEGFTSYYGPLVMQRAGLAPLDDLARQIGGAVDAVANSPARHVRSAVQMSRMAPFVDGARFLDETNFDITFLSYYTWGAGIGLALDLSLRERTGGRVTLDHFMRAMWKVHGRPRGTAPGLVAKPYTAADIRDRLAEVSGDRVFADDFYARFIEGREAPDYARLLAPAGFVVRAANPGRAWMGDLGLESRADGGRVTRLLAPGTPAHDAGIDRDDVVESVDGRACANQDALASVLAGKKAGDRVDVRFSRRSGERVSATVTLAWDPALEVVPLETTGARLTPAQERFRAAWLGSAAR